MEKNGISSCDFTPELAKKNEAFLELYLNSLEDGIISDEEENKLIALSIKIRDLLEKYLKV
jgi:hypothetical protein